MGRARGWRWALGVVVGAVVLAWGGAGTALGAPLPQVNVTINSASGSSTQSFSTVTVGDSYDISLQNTTIVGSSPCGCIGSGTTSFSGLSIAGLAELAGVDPGHITGTTTISNPVFPSTVVSLTPQEITQGFGDTFNPQDTQPSYALINTGGQNFEFIRPMRSPSDDNGADALFVFGDLDVTFNVSGGLLSVSTPATSPSPAAIRQNQSVSFSAPSVTTSSGAPDGNPLTYAWDFGDGGPGSSNASSTRSFATAGSFSARVTVTDPATNSSGVSPPVAVTVKPIRGAPNPSPGSSNGSNGPGSGSGDSPLGSTLGGSTALSGGGTSPHGPAHGAAHGKGQGSVTRPGSVARRRPHPKRRTPQQTASTQGGSSLGATTGSGAGAAGAGAGQGAARGAARGCASAAGPDCRGSSTQRTPADSGPPRIGFLIGSTGQPVPERQVYVDRALPTARAVAGSARRVSVPAWILSVAIVALVVLAGAWLERGPRRGAPPVVTP